MGKVVLLILVAVLALHSLAIVGFVGYGAATGRFDSESRGQYLATWRGEKLVPPPQEIVQEEKEQSLQEAAAHIAATEIDNEVSTREIQRHLELLGDMQATVAAARKKLEKDLEQMRLARAELEEKIELHQSQAKEEGFRQALKNYSEMKPKMVRDDFMQMEDEEVVRFLSAMKTDTATSILNQFKTEQEKNKRVSLMRLLQTQGAVELANKL